MQKWTDLAISRAGDPIHCTDMIQTSKGVLLFVDYDRTNAYLKYTVDRKNITTLYTLTSSAWTLPGTQTLTIDNSDNVYLGGYLNNSPGDQFQFIKFTNTGKTSWTNSGITGTIGYGSAVSQTSFRWVNNGSANGVLLCANILTTTTLWIHTLDPNSGSQLGSQGYTPGSGYSLNSGPNIDIGVSGSTAFVPYNYYNAGTYYMQPLGVSIASGGTMTMNGSGTAISHGSSSPPRIRTFILSNGSWAFISSASSTQYNVAIFRSGLSLSAQSGSGTPTNMPMNGNILGYDAYQDPTNGNKIWIMAPSTTGTTPLNIYRMAATCSTNSITFDSAATLEDSYNVYANLSNPDIICAKTSNNNIVDWANWVESSSSVYSLYGDYTNFGGALPWLVSVGRRFYNFAAKGWLGRGMYSSF